MASLVAAAAAAKLLQLWPILCVPIEGTYQASLFLRFSRQEHWSGLPFPSLPWWLVVKKCACSAGDVGSIPGLGRFPGEGRGKLL